MSEPSQPLLATLQDASGRLRAEVGKVIVGQEQVLDELLICLFTRSHALLVGVPGVAKTLLCSSVARALGLDFRRVQFTPDLMPSDITGTEIIEEGDHGRRERRFVKGPVFTNILLADEINRTPPKTQASLLEAMQERSVSSGGVTMPLPAPFFVLATQNPIEQEGTYPLPEAQQDRFLFHIEVGYPSHDEELEVLRRTTVRQEQSAQPVLTPQQVLEVQNLVREVPCPDHVMRHALALVRATRGPERGQADTRPEFIRNYVSFGAGPRASQGLVLAAKAHALLRGRTAASVADIRAVAAPVMRHRLGLHFAAQADGVSSSDVVARLLEAVPATAVDTEAAAVLR